MSVKKAFGYLRVSGQGQLDGLGFQRQKEIIEEYAKENGKMMVKYYKEEAVSGTMDETQRPAFQHMIAEILKDGVRTVIVEGLDRLAREYRIQENLLVYLASKGVELISARTGENVTEAIEGDPVRKALVQMQAIFFELEKNQLVLRLKKARERVRKERGKCEGRKGYGEESDNEKQIIKNIRMMRRRRRGGHRGMTYRAISEILNSQGIVTKHGKQWTAQLVHHVCKRL
jgi:DNA invertase Pin-like site-specific DNA recombinase